MAVTLRGLFLSSILLTISRLNGQFPKKEKFSAVREEIPYIKCETCQKAVKYLYWKTQEMRGNAAKKLQEDKIIDLVEKSCDPEKTEGLWLSKIDLVERNGELRLLDQREEGKCKRECQTISKACEESIAEVDTDVAELLWKNTLSLSKLINKVCHSMSSVCEGKTPRLRSGERRIDEQFQVMTEDEKKADEILKQMRGMPGMPGMEMYSREDIEKMHEELGANKQENEEMLDSEENIFHGEDVSFLQTVLDGLKKLWSWIKSIFDFGRDRSSEL